MNEQPSDEDLVAVPAGKHSLLVPRQPSKNVTDSPTHIFVLSGRTNQKVGSLQLLGRPLKVVDMVVRGDCLVVAGTQAQQSVIEFFEAQSEMGLSY
jgi:hypothetical protein